MSKRHANWMIYGANGYTGTLIAREAKRRGLEPVLAGRNEARVRELAHSLGFQWRSFACENPDEVRSGLRDMHAVLHCAGPFSATSKPMVKACLQAKCHYLDITGEIPVFERLLSKPDIFREAGIVALPGVGFDIVPSDCLLLGLKERLPDTIRLTLGLKPSGGFSPGTLKTMIEGLWAGAAIREGGKLKLVPTAARVRRIPFSGGEERATLFSWADVSAAYYSTGVPDIEVYAAVPPRMLLLLRALRPVRHVFALKPLQMALKATVDATARGPAESARENARYELWGEATNASGDTVRAGMTTPNGYTLTVDSALAAVTAVLEERVKPGAWTPSQAFGSAFAGGLLGVSVLQA